MDDYLGHDRRRDREPERGSWARVEMRREHKSSPNALQTWTVMSGSNAKPSDM